MVLTTEQWLLVGSYVLTGIVALLNFGGKIWKSATSTKIDESTNTNLLNENIRLANERAFKSEKDAVGTEARFEEREKRLTKRIDDLEDKLNLTVQENKTLKSEMAEMHIKQAMSNKQIDEQRAQIEGQRIENVSLKEKMSDMSIRQLSSDKLIEEQRMAQMVSRKLIEEQRREIIALQDFSERLITQVVGHGDSPVEYKPEK